MPASRAAHRTLVVTLHDVAPPFEAEIRAQLARLADIGVRRCVLKVVPNWHGSHPLAASPSLVELLRAQISAGSELVLHGFEHRPHGPLRGSPWSRLRGTVFAPDAAEFLTLSPAAAAQSVREGLDRLEEAGLPRPSAFCAPGWLLAGDIRPVLASAGIRYLIGMFSVHDLQAARRYRLPAIGYMGASPGQEAGIRLLNCIVRRTVLPRAAAAKVYLHPQGGMHNAARCRTLEELATMVGEDGWVPTTYAEMSREL